MRRLFGLGIVLLVGCAHAPDRSRTISEADDAAPMRVTPPVSEWHRNIKIVSRRPAHYEYVGRVRGSAPDGDFVAAAKQARAQISLNAEKLGADVIKIERLDPTAPGHRVVMAGRAYRLAD